MKVKLNVGLTGTRNGEDWPAKGEVVDLPDAEAVDMLNAGLALPVKDEAEQATAQPDDAERAVAKRPAKKAPAKKAQ